MREFDMKRTKVILAAATLTVAGLALPASASAAAQAKPAPAIVIHGIQPMGHAMGTSCAEMMGEV
jgi:hypothetical protein